MNPKGVLRRILPALAAAGALLAGASGALLATCGPFTDIPNDAFCPLVLEIFYLGITTGTTPTTYDPSSPVSRVQMAAFLSRSVDGVLRRGSRRAPMQRFWTPQFAINVGSTTVGGSPFLCQSDGGDIWVANSSSSSNSVSRVRGSDGKLLDTWTGAGNAYGVLAAMGRILVTGWTSPGRLYSIDPTRPAGSVTTVASTLGSLSRGLAFDGGRIWTANSDGTVSIVTPVGIPWTVTTVTVSSGNALGAVFDGSNIWVTSDVGKLLKLDADGAVLQTVTLGGILLYPAYDGANIWIPNSSSNSVSVVRASSGAVLRTLTGALMNTPIAAAFDGERVLVTSPGNDSVSLWKAADLTPLGPPIALSAGSAPWGACSDGINFWIALLSSDKLARF